MVQVEGEEDIPGASSEVQVNKRDAPGCPGATRSLTALGGGYVLVTPW
jgi:hypothetical protein